MSIHLDIGPEEPAKDGLPLPSRFVLNLKGVDNVKKRAAHEDVSLDLKEEIKWKQKGTRRLCILSEFRPSREGLGRIPMLAGALLIILVLNIGQLVFLGKQEGSEALALASEAFISLKGAGEAALTSEDGADSILFQDAEDRFQAARQKGAFLLQSDSPWLKQPALVKSLDLLLSAGSLMAEVGGHLSRARAAFNQLPAEGSFTDFLRNISETEIEPATQKLHQIAAYLDTVDLSDTPYAANLEDFKSQLDSLMELTDTWTQIKEPLLTALGDRYPQHYLVLLENNDEMRPGGGFIGSLAVVEINDGRLQDLQFSDVYQWDGNYFVHQEIPIHELEGLTTEWRLRDSNISPDFPTSAQKAAWFFEQEGGPGVDGVIAVNLSAAQAFLEDTGPLTLASLPKALTAETFPAVISTLVEAKLTQNPKAVLGEMIDAFIARSTDSNLQKALLGTALKESQKKQILFYHKDPSVQNLIQSFGLAGDLPDLATLDHDFLMPVFTNIGGNKTDRFMQTNIAHQTRITEDGSMIASVTIQRTHTFDAKAAAWLKSTLADYNFTDWTPTLESVLGNSPNHTGIRLYVPENARILETEGIYRDEVQFYYDPILDLSYYYVDQVVQPGQSESFTVHFTLPWRLGGDFNEVHFSLFKQPGLKNVSYFATIVAPEQTLLSSYPLATDYQPDSDYILSGPFQNDVEFTALYR